MGTLDGRKGVEKFANSCPERINGSGGDGAKQGFEFREDLFDGVEVGTVGREIENGRSRCLDGGFYARHFMRGEIVHDNDVALAQRWDQALFNPRPKAVAVDGAVEHSRSRQFIPSQGGKESRRLPVSMRY